MRRNGESASPMAMQGFAGLVADVEDEPALGDRQFEAVGAVFAAVERKLFSSRRS